MKHKGPGKDNRRGICIAELFRMFPDETATRKWIESQRWPNGDRYCPHCGCTENIHAVPKEKPLPYRCADCRKYFSVRTGTLMERSKIPLQKWLIAIYLLSTNLKGVSSMKLHRDLGITQKSAWFLSHRIRKAYEAGHALFCGPVEADETFIGGKEANKHWNKKLRSGRGAVGKITVVGVKDRKSNKVRAQVIKTANSAILKGFVRKYAQDGAAIYTDENKAYVGLLNHKTVKHGVREYVRDKAHTNGIESFWSMLKRGYYGTYHYISPQHLQRYVDEFTGRHNMRNLGTLQ